MSASSSVTKTKQPFTPLRELPSPTPHWKKGDVLVLFGELFSRGYANGLVDEAKKQGLQVIRSTVGRRDQAGQLRALDSDELRSQAQGDLLINIPLEAGFDLEEVDGNDSPVDQLQGIKMGEWAEAKLDWNKVEISRKKGEQRFRQAVRKYMAELDTHIPAGANVLFAHTMAGGVPRAKIFMPTMNRIFKGLGDRFESSEKFWNSDLGRLAEMSFAEVTANTFSVLLHESQSLRQKIEQKGGVVAYTAYGYHGTEVMVAGKYQWQSYSPYVQGWAKLKLEDFVRIASAQGIRASVFNLPEILTNSSSIFLGVEICLYPLLAAIRKEGASQERAQSIVEESLALLKPDRDLPDVLKLTDDYMRSALMQEFNVYEEWPRHNRKDQMEAMLTTSSQLIGMHKDPKVLMTFNLSEEVFKACGYIMFREAYQPRAPVLWLGHDCLAKTLSLFDL